MTSPTIMTSHVTTEKQPEDDGIVLLVVEIAVPCIVVVIVVVVVVIILIRRKKKKSRDTVYNVKVTERSRCPSSDENRISTLSSTPINPYELMSVYARMPLKSNESININNNQSSVNTSTCNLDNQSPDDNYTTLSYVTSPSITNSSNDVGNDSTELSDVNQSVYAKVDKRQTRKRTLVGQDVIDVDNEAMCVNGQVMANDNGDVTESNYEVSSAVDRADIGDDVSVEDVVLY